MNAAVSSELSGRQDAQPCSEAEHRPCLRTSSGIKAGMQIVSALLSALTFFVEAKQSVIHECECFSC